MSMNQTHDLQDLHQLLGKHDACHEARSWAKPFTTSAEAWAACQRPDWMLWALKKVDWQDVNKLRLFACNCIFSTPLTEDGTTWDLLTDPRSRQAVETAKRFVAGLASDKELELASSAAWAVAKGASSDAWAAWAAAWTAAKQAAAAATWAAAWIANAVLREKDQAAWERAQAAQAQLLRDLIGNPFSNTHPRQ